MQTLIWLAKWLTTLIQIIKAIEAAVPESGQGAMKLEMVRKILELVDDSIPAIWPHLEKVIGVIVAGFNRVGIFESEGES